MPSVNGVRAWIIPNRTDAAGADLGAGIPDVDQEEYRRMLAGLTTPGITPNLLDQTPNPNAFRVRQNTGSDMNLLIGSGVAKRDGLYLLGTVAGQGMYSMTIETATLLRAVPATDPSNPRRYGVYAFVNDASYGGTAGAHYMDVACIAGTPAGSPATPAPLATWSAYALLHEFQLAAGALVVRNVDLDASNGYDRRRTARALRFNPFVAQIFT